MTRTASRSEDTRQDESRPSDEWRPADALPTPDPVDGWSFRWIRVANKGEADKLNPSKKLREGWQPVSVSDHPELKYFASGERESGEVEVGGLLLCKMPTSKIKSREKYYQDLNARQMEGVDSDLMRENNPKAPFHAPQRSSRVSRFADR
jgi:hypothetical protein